MSEINPFRELMNHIVRELIRQGVAMAVSQLGYTICPSCGRVDCASVKNQGAMCVGPAP